MVNITDQDKKIHIAWKLLVQGDHFGEISVINNCPATCSVLTRNYNTLARLYKERYRMLVQEYQEFGRLMVKNTYKYNDPMLTFTKTVLWQIKLFRKLKKSTLYEFIF